MLTSLRDTLMTATLRIEDTASKKNARVSTEKPDTAEASVAEARQSLSTAPSKGMTVNLSAPGLIKSAQQQDKTDIDESGLPEPIKNLLKHIRELKKQLAEKQQERQETLADPSLSDEEKANRVQMLQGEISALNSALIVANHSLTELIKAVDMTDEQVSKALMLSMK